MIIILTDTNIIYFHEADFQMSGSTGWYSFASWCIAKLNLIIPSCKNQKRRNADAPQGFKVHNRRHLLPWQSIQIFINESSF